ncbi:MAG: DNA-3-methyladenine glycosylase I [Verrucomicrobiales bacterium]|nr:DNA-3-methyladenine glycosylase I [Verrucomicrobiales bacterium]
MNSEIPRGGLDIDPDTGTSRCFWPGNHPDYIAYHDEEWGRPVDDDQRLFEKICLEGFQSGLSWLTILRKRENFRAAFCDFNFRKVAGFGSGDIERLLQDAGIVRHRRKIESTINNAARACEMVDEFGSLGAFFWKFEPDSSARPKKLTIQKLFELNQTPESTALSRELKQRGWSFIGPTTAYAFMQAMGLVNDHLEGCAFRSATEESRNKFCRPA